MAEGVGGGAGSALAHAARSAYVEGMGLAALVAALVVGATAVVASRLLPADAPIAAPPSPTEADLLRSEPDLVAVAAD